MGRGTDSESASWLRFRFRFILCRCRCHCPWLRLVQRSREKRRSKGAKDLRLGGNLPTIKCRNKTRNSARCVCESVFTYVQTASLLLLRRLCLLAVVLRTLCSLYIPLLRGHFLLRHSLLISCSFLSWLPLECCCCIVQIYAHVLVLLPVSQILLHLFRLPLFIYKAKARRCWSGSNCSLFGLPCSCHVRLNCWPLWAIVSDSSWRVPISVLALAFCDCARDSCSSFVWGPFEIDF